METAPDGSIVYPLTRSAHCSTAQFVLEAGAVTRAVYHRHVEEVWHVTDGHGEIWLAGPDGERTVALCPGVTVSIAPGVRFQFRAVGENALRIFGVTAPPWPLEGQEEAVITEGPWVPTIDARAGT